MLTLVRCYPGDRTIELFLVVALCVALLSSAAWLISRQLAGHAALRHLVLLSALISCLACPVVTGFFAAVGVSFVSIHVLRAEQGSIVPAVPPMSNNDECTPPPCTTSSQSSTSLPAAASPSPHQNASTFCCPAPAQRAATTLPTAAPAPPMPSGGAGMPWSLRTTATAAMLVWAAGVLLMLARLGRNYACIIHLRRGTRPVEHESLQILLQEIVNKLRPGRPPRLLVSSRTVIPLAVDFGRPAVILPQRLIGAISDEEMRDILLHEVAHLQRNDQWIALLQEVAGALYWPVLSVHLLNRELRRAREEICDNVVLTGRSAVSYGRTLLHVAELLVRARPMGAALGIIGGRGELERRVAGLIDPRRNMTTTTGRTSVCIVMFASLITVSIASATRFGASASAATASSATQSASTSDPDDPALAAHFRGRVTGPYGNPIARARVFVASMTDAPACRLAVRAETNGNGRFEFDAPDMTYIDLDGLPARRECLVVATADGYGPDWVQLESRRQYGSNRDKQTDPELKLARDDVPVHGRFLDPDGRPLAGARVRLVELMIPPKRDLDAHLNDERKRSILGCATSYERELYQPRLIPSINTEARTDADGRFTLSGLGRDRLATLAVSAPSVIDTQLEVMTRDTADVRVRTADDAFIVQLPKPTVHGAGFTMQLKRGLTVRGVVRDRDTHAPIPGMWVAKNRNPLSEPAFAPDAAVTDEHGRFTISGLDPQLLIWKPEFRDLTAFPQPGGQYAMSKGIIDSGADVVIDCPRGIGFRLKLIDEQGKPIDAEVEYRPLTPNPKIADVLKPFANTNWSMMDRAARRADGTYEGFVLPGPGAVLVTTPGQAYRHAHVDVKQFVATYGMDVTTSVQGFEEQNRYAAIVLVNPSAYSSPLQLSAKIVKSAPRMVSLVDPDGKPVAGVKTSGITPYLYDYEPPLRAATFPLIGLNPDCALRITFTREDRQLIGSLVARGDGDSPYTVRMQPWATITGRLLDQNGKPLSAGLFINNSAGEENPDPEVGVHASVSTDDDCGFKIDQVVPGQRYTAQAYRDNKLVGTAFDKLVLEPGENRNLGDVRVATTTAANLKQ